MKNFAMLGKWHVHAPGYARELGALEGCRVTHVWDPDEQVAQAWAQELSCRSASLEEILKNPEIHGVIVCCATNEHAPVLIRACEAGKAVFTEKVLTLKTADALCVKDAVHKNKTRFAISFPYTSDARIRFAKDLVCEGKLGTVSYARVRNAHNGAVGDWLPPHFYDPIACGGGAMIDLGAHPMYLLCALLGEPEGVQSAFTKVTGRAVEDNAVSVLRFANGVLGVSETGFLSARDPLSIEISGSKGIVKLRGTTEILYSSEETDGEWRAPDALPGALPSPLAQWAASDEPIPDAIGIDAAVRLTRVMEAAYAPAAAAFEPIKNQA